MKFFLIILIVFLSSCETNDKYPIDKSGNETITVATFNIEWLGDGYNDRIERSEEDVKKIVSVFNTINADIYALQEIENSKALDRVTKYLDNKYEIVIFQSSSHQNCAYLINSDRVIVNDIDRYDPIAVIPGKTRPGNIIQARVGNFDFEMLNVHFKSTSRYDDTEEKRQASFEMRRKQAKVAVDWADSVITFHDKDVIILGDLNDSPIDESNQTLTSLVEGNIMLFLTADFKSCKYKGWNSIDHILVSQSANMRVVDNSIMMINLNNMFTEEDIELISDHCPVICRFEISSADND